MPRKRRLEGDTASEDGGSNNKKRKTDVVEICQELYETIRNHKIEGRLVCETFIRAPKRRNQADYYDAVQAPIDLSRIQQKIKLEEYDDIDQMTNDIELLVNNAKTYFKPGTQEYQDACDLWALYNEAKSEILGIESFPDDSSSTNAGDCDSFSNHGTEGSIDDENPMEELFSAVMTATADDGRNLNTMFQLLPSKLKYPDYYKIIQDPIDLKTIASKIQSGSYAVIGELEKDLLLMVRNAKTYNEPGSQIYKDANTLRRIIVNKKQEIDQRKYQPTKSSERIRTKRSLPAGQKWSSIAAALKYENESDYEPLSITTTSLPVSINEDTLNEEPNESDPEDAESNPQWQLYEAVRSYTSTQGVPLSDPFMRLPNRRFYPDYYQEIKQPMSLSKIKSKIKNGFYRSTIEVIDDMNIMFENAKKYNRPDSKIFKDACKLQKIMQAKAKELVNYAGKDSDSSDSDNEDSCSGMSARKGSGRKKGYSNALHHELKRARRTNSDIDTGLKKRMKLICKTLIDFVDDQRRQVIGPFMEKPSKKDYPDYYEIIENPIDMKTIEANVKNDKYASEDNFIADFKLMFANCKQYNEEGSQIYRDAELLESVLMDKLAELGSYVPGKSRKQRKSVNMLLQKLKTLYDAVLNYADPKTGRQLSTIFMKLPSKTDYPDYYDVIKKPMDLDKIGTKLKNNQFESLDDLLSDLVLVFDNACKYNEPDSQLYKDALTLQHVALQTKLEMSENESQGIPNIRAIIQDLLSNLFISVYNHQDEEGRCYSDSIIELSEQESRNADPNERRPLNLDMIKKNLDKKRYRRLDRFQQDMFEVFERTRRNARVDSQAFEDSIELQLYFIRLRNELCRNGEVLQSNALNYTENHLNANVESLKMEKLPFEQQEVEMDTDSKCDERDSDPGVSNSVESISEVSLNDQIYRPGDFVYIEPREKNMDPHIINISKLWRDTTGQIWIYGCWFYRPFETYHIASKRFLEKEVFKSDSYNNAPLSQVVGKCFIMFVKDYFKLKPQGFDDRDVYVCESRYFTRTKTFKKIKLWPYFNNYPLVPRDKPLPMVRVPSIFKDTKGEKSKEEGNEEDDDDGPKLLDIDRPNIIQEPGEGVPVEEGAIYYEQFTIPSGSYKLGDCCYVRTDTGRNLICRIDRMWVDKEGNAFFHGPWFVQPKELPPLTPRMFYPQEVFLSSIEDTNPLLSICEKCTVMEYKDYTTKRPTEIPEQDIYICELKYLEHDKKFTKLPFSIRRMVPPKPGVAEDEYYMFRKPLVISRTEYGAEKSAVLAKKGQSHIEAPSPLTSFRPSIDTENDESNDVSSLISETPLLTTPYLSRKKISKRIVTGYIIFAGEVRRSVVQANPDCNFGDISRIIGNEWKNLPADTKAEYERRAQKQNEESAREAAREAERLESFPQSPLGYDSGVYECHWENKCDFQCEDSSDLYEHLNGEPNGHVWKSYGDIKDKEEAMFQCLFQGCGRVKKGAPPFPSIHRLIRHCKEIHVNKQIPKYIPPENRSKNFTPGRKSLAMASFSPSTPNHCNNLGSSLSATTTICGVNISRSTPPPPVLSFYDNNAVGSSVSHASYGANGLSYQSSNSNMPSLSPYWVSNSQGTGVQAKPVEPLFVAAHTRPNRLLHSSTFIEYIKRLRSDCKHVSNWEHQVNANPENTPIPHKNRLPVHWLANGEGNHGNIVNALWALRNFMLQDSLNIARL